MARLTVAATITFDHFPQLSAELEAKASQVVRKTAFDIQAGAQQRARVDTGAMANGFYTMTNRDDGYQFAALKAEALRPDVAGHILPAVAQPTDNLHAVVAAAVDYTIYNEMGTSRMSAQPMLTPAAEAARGPYKAAMQQILDEIA